MMKPFAFAVATVISACNGQFLVHTEEQASLFETEYVEHVTRLGKEFFKYSQDLGPNVDITLHNYLQSVDMLKKDFFCSQSGSTADNSCSGYYCAKCRDSSAKATS